MGKGVNKQQLNFLTDVIYSMVNFLRIKISLYRSLFHLSPQAESCMDQVQQIFGVLAAK